MKWQDILVRVLVAALAALAGALTERQAPGVLTAPAAHVLQLAPVARPPLDVPSGLYLKPTTRVQFNAPAMLWV